MSAETGTATLNGARADSQRFRALVRSDAFALTLLVGGAIALRMAVAERELWLDETISVLHTRGSLADVIEEQGTGFHPPLYHVLLHFWSSAFGVSESALRSLSMVWSIIAVLAVWGWSREALGHRSAVIAATVLAAVSPFAVWYGSEARMYAQLFALTALAGYAAWRILDGRGGRLALIGLTCSLTALLYTHYFGSLFLGALGLACIGLLVARPSDRSRALRVLGGSAAALAALLPWLAWTATKTAARGDPPTYPAPDIYSAFTSGIEMVIGFHSPGLMSALTACWPLLCLLGLVLLPRIHSVGWSASALGVLLVAPPAFLVAASYWGPYTVFDPRYLTVCAAPLYLLVGRLWSLLPAHMLRPVAACLLVGALSAASVWQKSDPGNPKLFEVGSAIAAVNAEARPSDALVVAPEFQATPVLSYYRPAAGVETASMLLPSEAWRRLRRNRPERVFLITSFEDRDVSSRYSANRFPRFFSKRSRLLAKAHYVNVTLRAYDPDWSRG